MLGREPAEGEHASAQGTHWRELLNQLA